VREFVETDELKGVRVLLSDMSGAELRGVDLSNLVITDAWLMDADISGDVRGMTVNGVEIEPLVEAELDRRHPERVALRPTDLAGLRDAMDVVDAMWGPTVERARALPPELLHERVAGEFSFIETLRHLLFAVDAWVIRMVLREPNAYHRWGLPPDLHADGVHDGGPELDEVLQVRAERYGRVRRWLAEANEADLDAVNPAPDPDGHPQGDVQVRRCFSVLLREEWWHHRYAVRDLAVLEGR
jgi:hypothetical protein